MEKVSAQQKIGVEGYSRQRSWKKGVIESYLALGMNLRQAMECAEQNGALVDEQRVHNTITTVGLALVCDMIIGDDTSSFSYHAIGTSSTTPAISDTTLGTEVERKAFSLRERSANIVTLSVFYTAAESTYNIQECGIFGGDDASESADSGVLFSHFLEAKDNSGGSYDLTFEYELTVSEVSS